MIRLRKLGIIAILVAGAVSAVPAEAHDPDLISLGLGWYDETLFNPSIGPWHVSETDPKAESADFRLEYRFGYSLIPFIEPWANLKPFLGAEATSDGALFGHAGLMLEFPIGSFFITPSANISAYNRGGGKDQGSVLMFRTMLELGYQFENRSRVSVQYSHISDADLTHHNPGANLIGVYYHLPASWVFGD